MASSFNISKQPKNQDTVNNQHSKKDWQRRLRYISLRNDHLWIHICSSESDYGTNYSGTQRILIMMIRFLITMVVAAIFFGDITLAFIKSMLGFIPMFFIQKFMKQYTPSKINKQNNKSIQSSAIDLDSIHKQKIQQVRSASHADLLEIKHESYPFLSMICINNSSDDEYSKTHLNIYCFKCKIHITIEIIISFICIIIITNKMHITYYIDPDYYIANCFLNICVQNNCYTCYFTVILIELVIKMDIIYYIVIICFANYLYFIVLIELVIKMDISYCFLIICFANYLYFIVFNELVIKMDYSYYIFNICFANYLFYYFN